MSWDQTPTVIASPCQCPGNAILVRAVLRGPKLIYLRLVIRPLKLASDSSLPCTTAPSACRRTRTASQPHCCTLLIPLIVAVIDMTSRSPYQGPVTSNRRVEIASCTISGLPKQVSTTPSSSPGRDARTDQDNDFNPPSYSDREKVEYGEFTNPRWIHQ